MNYTNLSLYVPINATNELTGKPLIIFFTSTGAKSYFQYVNNQNSRWDQTVYLLPNAYILSVDLENESKNFKHRALRSYKRENFKHLLECIDEKFERRNVIFAGYSRGASQLFELLLKERSLFNRTRIILGAP